MVHFHIRSLHFHLSVSVFSISKRHNIDWCQTAPHSCWWSMPPESGNLSALGLIDVMCLNIVVSLSGGNKRNKIQSFFRHPAVVTRHHKNIKKIWERRASWMANICWIEITYQRPNFYVYDMSAVLILWMVPFASMSYKINVLMFLKECFMRLKLFVIGE